MHPVRQVFRQIRRVSVLVSQVPVVGVVVRAIRRTMAREVMLFAGGVSFFTLLALFPAVAAAASIYGLVFSIGDAQDQISRLAGVLPPSARSFAINQVAGLAEASSTTLSIQGLVALLISFFAASRGAKALIAGLNQIAKVGDLRSIVKFNLLAIAAVMAGGTLLAFANLIVLTIPVFLRPILQWLGLRGLDTGYLFNEWTAVAVTMIAALILLYRYTMRRAGEVSWNASILAALTATLIWMVISAGFSFYVQGIVHPNAYGSLGALIVFLLWIYWASYAVFFGGALAIEIDLKREHG
ncbi:MAG: ribonuclease BN [Maricaulis sp.]|jgi:membrane protein|nr:ribonuclease BN [Maricaulis sp.]HAQ33750.1 YihY/virulence factor BrkB family protein [Alphaproteobacteria bacterium]